MQRSKRGVLVLLGSAVAIVLLIVLASCARPTPTPTPRPTPTATPRPLTTPTATPIPTPTPTVSYAGKVVVGYTWGGTIDDGLRASACRTLTEKYGATCNLVPGSSLMNISKIIAEKADPQGDFTEQEDTFMFQLINNKVVSKFDFNKMPNAKYFFKGIDLFDGQRVPFMSYVNGFCYRTDMVGKLLPGVTLKKYADLWRPEFKESIAFTPPTYTMASHWLDAASVIAGKPDDPAAGFQKLLALKPNIKTIFGSTATAQKMIFDGEVAVAAVQDGRCFAAIDQGAPAAFVAPEDYPTGGFGGVIMVREKNKDLMHLFANELLDAKNQADFAEFGKWGPSVNNASQYLSIKLRVRVLDTQEEWDKMKRPNWKLIETAFPWFVDKFNKEIATK